MKTLVLTLIFIMTADSLISQVPVKNESIDSVASYQIKERSLTGKTSNGIFSLEIWSENVIRVRITDENNFEEQPYAVIASPDSSVSPEIIDGEDAITIKTKSLLVEVRKKPLRVTFKDTKGSILNQDDPQLGVSWLGDEMTAYKTLFPNERFIGLGEKTGPLDRRGNGYTNWNTDYYGYGTHDDPLYASIPFYIGVKDELLYGIYVNNSYKSHFNFGAGNNRFSSFTVEHGDIDYFFMHAESVPKIIDYYTYLTGRMPMPPIWSLGYHQSRYSYANDKDVLLIAASLRAKRIPCDVIHLDIHHMDAYKVFTWDPKNFSTPRELTSQLYRQGFHTTVIIDPGIKVEDGYEPYEEGKKDDLFVKYPDGTYYVGDVWPGSCHFPDFTNPKTRTWWGEKLKTYAFSGVDSYWIDMNEIAVWGGRHMPSIMEFDFEGDGGTMAKARNLYALKMAHATYDAGRKILRGQRPFLLTRAAFSGSQRYTAIWTGDNNSNDNHMLAGVRLVSSLGLSGFSYAGFDVGGFTGNPRPDLYGRWITVGAFMPFFRGHTAINTNASEPWSYGERIESIARDYIQMRYNLLPYFYTQFYKSSLSGMPIVRSLALYYPFDEKVYDHQFHNQFLLGNALLVAPSKSNKKYTKVYLPDSNINWYDYHTFTKYRGGQETVVPSDIETLPVFIREGSVLTLQSPVLHTAQSHNSTLYLHVFNGKEGSELMYYEDDGLTYEFEEGTYHRRNIQFVPKTKLSLSKVEGLYKSKFTKIKFFFHGFPQSVKLKSAGQFLKTNQETFSFHMPEEEHYKSDFETQVMTATLSYSNNAIDVSFVE